MGSQSPLCLERIPRKRKAVRQQKNNIDNTSSANGICEFMGILWEKALARELHREAEEGPDAKSLSKWPLRTWNLAGAHRYDTFQTRS